MMTKDYAKLDGEYRRYAEVALHFRYRVPPQDKGDLVQDALLEMLERSRRNGRLSDEELWRAAKTVLGRYWRARERHRRCISLNIQVGEDGEGPELWQMLADDKAVDLGAWLDARLQLQHLHLPPRVVEIAQKRVSGLPLTNADQKCLVYFWGKIGRARGPKVALLGERVKELRQRLHWSLRDLAHRSGLSKSQISRYEVGQHRHARRFHLERLAQALGVSIDYLTSADDPNSLGKTLS